MRRLLIHVEGETEETFVNEVLAPHLVRQGFLSVRPRLIGDARKRSKRGGGRAWFGVRRDILRQLRRDQGFLAAIMVDFYALPASGPRAWPGRDEASRLRYPENGRHVQSALGEDIHSALEDRRGRTRFIPLIVLHEFEGLLFSDCTKLAAEVDRPDLAASFQQIRDEAGGPEEIDDSPETAPSKRIQRLYPRYQKTFHGPLAAAEIGMTQILESCPHFRSWVEDLEAAANA